MTQTKEQAMSVWDACGILLPNPAAAERQFRAHPDLLPHVEAVSKKRRETFGDSTELSLDVYTDPETRDQYLTLYVRQDPYQSDLLDRIEAVCTGFHDQMESRTGYLLVTTDFARLGKNDAV